MRADDLRALPEDVGESPFRPMELGELGTDPREELDSVIPHSEQGDDGGRARCLDAVEDRLVVSDPVAETLNVERAALHILASWSARPSRGSGRAGGEGEAQRRSPEVRLVVDRAAERRSAAFPISITHVPNIKSATTLPAPTLPCVIFFWCCRTTSASVSVVWSSRSNLSLAHQSDLPNRSVNLSWIALRSATSMSAMRGSNAEDSSRFQRYSAQAEASSEVTCR
jgi:hypothetical protein